MEHCGKCTLHGFVLHRSESVLTCKFFELQLDIVGEILKELERAESIHPEWPSDPIYAASIMMEEAGEVVKAVNDAVEKGSDTEDCKTEAIQAAAMCIRFLKNFETYNWNKVKKDRGML
jgi:NTP pyrophosphatase (non-canonical NTP hydrolase)